MVDNLYFLHIPKTAGTSVTRFLDGQFRPETIFPYQLWSDYASSSYFVEKEAAQRYYRFYRGHFGRGFLNDVASTPTVVTFLREPRQHLLSLMNHMIIDRENGTELHPGLQPNHRSLSDYLTSGTNRSRLANVQARYLCSTMTSATIDDQHLAEGSFFTPLSRDQPGNGPLDHDRLAESLGSIDFVGVQEFYAESLLLMSVKLGLRPPGLGELTSRSMQLERTAERHELSPHDEECVAAITATDRLLHEEYRLRVANDFDQLAEELLGTAVSSLVAATSEQRRETAERVVAALQASTGSVSPATPQLDAAADERFANDSPSQSITVPAGGEAMVRFEFSNKSSRSFFGYTRFSPSSIAPMLLATDDPVNRISQFCHPTWFSENRPCSDLFIDKARPGRPDAFSRDDCCGFSFLIRAPERPGVYVERFAPVIEGVKALSDKVSFELIIEVTAT